MPILNLTEAEVNHLQFTILPMYLERMAYDSQTMRNTNQDRLADQFVRQEHDARVLLEKLETAIIHD